MKHKQLKECFTWNILTINELKIKNMVSLKEVFERHDWIITNITQGSGVHRIDAKRRYPIADESSFFSEWGSNRYLEKLAQENYGKKLSEFIVYTY